MENCVTRRPKILLYYKSFEENRWIGGAEFRLTQAIDLLKNRCELTLMTPTRPNWERINALYGSTIRDDEVKIVLVPHPLWRIAQYFFSKRDYRIRRIQSEAARHDLAASFDNFTDFGHASIQFITFYSFFKYFGISYPVNQQKPKLDSLRPRQILQFFFNRFREPVYYFLNRHVRRTPTFADIIERGDRVIANSEWAASFLKPFGYDATVLYPPVVMSFPVAPFERRSADFLTLSRIAPEKRIEDAIEIIDRLRRRTGRDVTLHLCGQKDDSAYCRAIERLAADKPWIVFEGLIFGERKRSLLTSCRYALHARRNEEFGISVAEFLRAGLIPFVPDTGGSAEIVRNPALCFHDIDDAVEKIACFLDRTVDEQVTVQKSLLSRGDNFDLKSFQCGLLDIFSQELQKRGLTLD